jgi:hypothetical protein
MVIMVTWQTPELLLILRSSAISFSLKSINVFNEMSKMKGMRPIRKKLSHTFGINSMRYNTVLEV